MKLQLCEKANRKLLNIAVIGLFLSLLAPFVNSVGASLEDGEAFWAYAYYFAQYAFTIAPWVLFCLYFFCKKDDKNGKYYLFAAIGWYLLSMLVCLAKEIYYVQYDVSTYLASIFYSVAKIVLWSIALVNFLNAFHTGTDKKGTQVLPFIALLIELLYSGGYFLGNIIGDVVALIQDNVSYRFLNIFEGAGIWIVQLIIAICFISNTKYAQKDAE